MTEHSHTLVFFSSCLHFIEQGDNISIVLLYLADLKRLIFILEESEINLPKTIKKHFKAITDLELEDKPFLIESFDKAWLKALFRYHRQNDIVIDSSEVAQQTLLLCLRRFRDSVQSSKPP